MPAQPSGPLDAFHEQLRSALDSHLASLSTQYEEALSNARYEMAAEADQAITARVQAVKAEWAARLEIEKTTLRAEAEQHLAAELAKAHGEADQRWSKRLEQELAAHKSEADKRFVVGVMQSRGEADEEWAARLQHEKATLRAEAEQRLNSELQKARSEVEQLWGSRFEQETASLRAAAEERLDAELQKARTDAEQRLDAELQKTRTDAEQRLDAELQKTRRDAEQHLDTELQKARTDVEQQWTAKLEQETASLRADAEHKLNADLQKTRADVEQQWTAKLDQEVATLRADLDQQWHARLHAQLDTARAEAAQQAAETIARARQELDELLAAERDRHTMAAKEMDSERQRLTDEMSGLSQRLRTLIEERDGAHANLANISRAHAELETEHERAQAELESERLRTAAEIESLRQRLDAVQDERRKAEAELEAERRRMASEHEQEQREAAIRLQALKDQSATELAAELAGARRQADEEIARVRREVAEAAEREFASRPAPVVEVTRPAVVSLDHLTTAMQSIESARTLTDALDALLRASGAVASRSVVFLINGDRVRSWKTVGFPQLETQPFDASIAGTGILAKAIQTGEAVASGAGQPVPTFAGAPADASAVAVPILVDDRAVGVLYADTVNSTGAIPSPAWRDIVTTLTRHASAVLALVTALKTAQALGVQRSGNGEADEQGARRYARLLVSEIKLYNEAAVHTGRERRDLLSRLRPEIERARRLYEERVPAVVSGRGQFFQQELVHTLADGDPALLGNA